MSVEYVKTDEALPPVAGYRPKCVYGLGVSGVFSGPSL